MSHIGHLLEPEIPRLRRYAVTLTKDTLRAEDLVQNCLVRALAKEHLWEPGTDLRAWLFTILHNQHVNEVRRLVHEGSAIPIDEAAPHLADLPSAEAAVDLGDVEEAIARLPEEHRKVILLAGREGMRYDEIATTLGIPTGTVRSRLSRARTGLRAMMGIDEATVTRRRSRGEQVPLRRAA
jgi:RNA polymerase sigma-70 factor (ECF subfamily)